MCPVRTIGFLACPARFERATYALEEIVATGMCIYFNDLHVKTGTVQWVLSGKPTFSSAPNVGAYSSQHPIMGKGD